MFKVYYSKICNEWVILDGNTLASDCMLYDLFKRTNAFKTEKLAKSYCEKLNKIFDL